MQIKKIELALYGRDETREYYHCGISSGAGAPIGTEGQTLVAADRNGVLVTIVFGATGPDIVIEEANGNRGVYLCKALRVVIADVVDSMTSVSYLTYGDTEFLEREFYEG